MINKPTKIGVIIAELAEGYDDRALKYLILHMNTLQSSFEYQLLPVPDSTLIEKLSFNQSVDRHEIEDEMEEFVSSYKQGLTHHASGYGLSCTDDFSIIVLSAAKFNDNYYQTGSEGWSVLALGNWESVMAPPSIVEFFISCLIRTSIDCACGNNSPTRHIGTKGCCFDFSASLSDIRFYVLSGLICTDCKETIEQACSEQLVQDACLLANKEWLGTVCEPSDASITAKKLGHDLFHTSGVKPTWKERLNTVLSEEGPKSLVKTFFVVIGAAIVYFLGLRSRG
ncbi:hypothetical protein ACM8C1_004615 [Vibrio parahaemolyticus]